MPLPAAFRNAGFTEDGADSAGGKPLQLFLPKMSASGASPFGIDLVGWDYLVWVLRRGRRFFCSGSLALISEDRKKMHSLGGSDCLNRGSMVNLNRTRAGEKPKNRSPIDGERNW